MTNNKASVQILTYHTQRSGFRTSLTLLSNEYWTVWKDQHALSGCIETVWGGGGGFRKRKICRYNKPWYGMTTAHVFNTHKICSQSMLSKGKLHTCIGGFHSILLHRTTLRDQLYAYCGFVPCGKKQMSRNCIYSMCYQTQCQYLWWIILNFHYISNTVFKFRKDQQALNV